MPRIGIIVDKVSESADWRGVNRNQLAVLVKDELTATDPAIRTNRPRDLGMIDARMHCARFVRHCIQACAIGPLPNLPNQWPFVEQLTERGHIVTHLILRQYSFQVELEKRIVSEPG